MTDEQREHIEERLREERQDTVKALAEFDNQFKVAEKDSDSDLSAFPFHWGDKGTDTMEREKEAMLASQEGRQLQAINNALERLLESPERFGTCQECGDDITFERLDVIPWTTRCIDCQNQNESSLAQPS